MAKKGSLSITSENIFPVIKKWLYSDHDIFYRELVSNGCDAITKLKKLDMMGEYELPVILYTEDGHGTAILTVLDIGLLQMQTVPDITDGFGKTITGTTSIMAT